MQYARKLYEIMTHLFGRLTKRYYFEDHVRVYPDGILYDRFGRKVEPTENDRKNYQNHCKFYTFVAQFAVGKRVADIGCGSGYGCEILKQKGAAHVSGADISRQSIQFARDRYGDSAEFSVQGITDLKGYLDASFDVTICSEVMEHIKEYGMEDQAVGELQRITRPGGIIVVATPNSEMLEDHGFTYDEMKTLMERSFSEFCIFENALMPFGDNKVMFERRMIKGNVGIVVSEEVNYSEIVLPEGVTPEVKVGMPPGIFHFSNYAVDTTLLHNTHSWVVLAIKNES